MSLVIIGSTVVDLIFPRVPRLPAWPRHTESTQDNLVLLRDAPIVTLGGNGANAAYVAARCGAAVAFHTQIGADALGELARRWLENAGCRLHAPKRAASTAVNVTVANARQERAMFFHPGAPGAMPLLASTGPAPSHLLVCGWPHPPLATIARGLRAARRRGVFTALDAGPILGRPWTPAALRPAFGALDLFLTNDYELRKITRAARLDAALARLRRDFTGHVVVKRGADGVLWLPASSDLPRHVPGRAVRVVNTVGAGDSFNGALLAGLVRGAAFPAALRAACAAAASVVASPRGVLGVRPPRAARLFKPNGGKSS
jgi:ribokinase